jgi:hypothetical protein
MTKCNCCGVTLTIEEWLDLPRIDELMCDGDGGWLELRNHECGSTLAVPYPYRESLSSMGSTKPGGGRSPLHPSSGEPFGVAL